MNKKDLKKIVKKQISSDEKNNLQENNSDYTITKILTSKTEKGNIEIIYSYNIKQKKNIKNKTKTIIVPSDLVD